MDGPISGEITLRNRCAGLRANSQLDIIILCVADRSLISGILSQNVARSEWQGFGSLVPVLTVQCDLILLSISINFN